MKRILFRREIYTFLCWPLTNKKNTYFLQLNFKLSVSKINWLYTWTNISSNVIYVMFLFGINTLINYFESVINNYWLFVYTFFIDDQYDRGITCLNLFFSIHSIDHWFYWSETYWWSVHDRKLSIMVTPIGYGMVFYHTWFI